MVHGMNGGAVICTACGAEVNPLDLFPGNICLPCHAVKHENDTPADMLRDILAAFGGR
jgi:hypothetical protein